MADYDHWIGGTGEPLLLLHPSVSSWHIWKPVLPALSAHHRVFAPTLPGHVGGPPCPGPLDLGVLADAVERQLDVMGIATTHVAGNSLGALVAVELGRRGRATSVTAFSPPGAWRGSSTALFLAAKLGCGLSAMQLPLPTAVLERYRPARRIGLLPVMQRGDLLSSEDFVRLARARRANSRFVLRLMAGVLRSGDLAPVLECPGTPVTIAWGDRDRVLPLSRFGHAARDLLVDARFSPLPGAGHVPMHDEPQLVIDTILSTTMPAAVADTAS
ncbi:MULTISPECIES: alpha/beta fold hydrolase [unclassified Nocardioides]|uniref:alpha/beta fold hydrolase n=1 Tax=unclassified Nocardioides TaxID=2615069 RepID=UPI0006F6A6A6|nr:MULTISPECIES: alpha/beta fold hydrolase [unclassified Nocardioides]KRA28011.1 hypothetical protein ASD81_22830 [Nocardioides sp. Root614]KRA85986.1 hypothetical protein ASD84_23070 [Nocardioides sp. Root682]